MSSKSPTHRLNGSAHTGRGPSPNLWRDVEVNNWLEDPSLAFHIFETFQEFPPHASTGSGAVSGALGKFQSYLYQGGAIADGNAQEGVLVFSSDGDNEGAALGYYTGGAILSASYGKCWFEARVKTSTIADTKHGFFCGLVEAGAVAAAVPLTTSGTLADVNLFGFHRLEGDGDQIDVGYKADGQTAQYALTDAISGGLVADTWIKLGFEFDPFADISKRIKIYVNGVELTTYITSANMAAVTFPSDEYLMPCFAVMNATGSTPGNSSIDWWRLAQKYV